jgi:hypothetical protein
MRIYIKLKNEWEEIGVGFAQGRWQKGGIRIDDGEMEFKILFF